MIHPPEEQGQPKIATQLDIAKRVGVSKVTVSRVMRGDYRNASRTTVNKILAVAHEIGYDLSQHHGARRLALSKYGQEVPNNVIALFFPRQFFNWNYFNTIFHNVLDTLMAAKYALVTNYTFESPEETLPPIFQRGDIDGAIVIGSQCHMRFVADRLRANPQFNTRPIISLVEPMPGCSSIVSDDLAGGYAAVSHLLDLGHRHLLYYRTQESYTHAQRVVGYRKAYLDRQLNPDRYLHSVDWRFLTPDLAELLLRQVLTEHQDITAILAPNDLHAQTVCEALKRQGLHVPEDISVVGYDDTDPVVDARGENVLTSVRVPLAEIGRKAADLITQRLAGQQPPAEQLILPTQLMLRGSTAEPRRAITSMAM